MKNKLNYNPYETFTFSTFGLSGNLLAATKNISGCGLPNFTRGSDEPQVLYGNKSNKS